MTERNCEYCDLFLPALTFVRKPAWGYCTRAVSDCESDNEKKARGRFTWADNICDDFRLRTQSVARE